MTRVVDFPDGWGTADPVPSQALVLSKGPLTIFGCLLEDGTNLFALVYPGGQRFARTAFAIDWGIEESYGPPPRRRHLAAVNATWRDIVTQMVEAGKAADADMVAAGLPRGRDLARELRRQGWEPS